MVVQEPKLETQIRFFKPYYDKNDRGHDIGHPLDVLITAFDIDMKLKLGIDVDDIISAVFIHDMFVHLGRSEHHVRACEFAMNKEYPLKSSLTKEQQKRVARAVREHRASYTGSFYSELSELISSADRGMPDFNKHIERAFINRHDKGEDDPRAGAIAHIKEKYGTGGYARYPYMYIKVYGDQITAQRAWLDSL